MSAVVQKLRWGAALLRARLAGPPRPIVVGWAVTKRCNYRCSYCRVWQDGREMSHEQALRLVDELARSGTAVLGLTGGEPLLREDLGELIGLAKRRGLRVHLATNGALLPERAELLPHLGRVTVSLDGPADVHDAIRGAGAFERAVAAVRLARQAGVSTRLAATIHAGNVHRLEEIVTTAVALGVPVVVQPALRTALGSDESSLASAGREPYRAAMQRLLAVRRRGRWAAVANSSACLRHLARFPDDAPVRCAGGVLSCRIEPMGDLFHCGRVRRSRPLQNALEVGFEAAFQSLGPMSCRQCWCANRMELNLLCQLDVSAAWHAWRTGA